MNIDIVGRIRPFQPGESQATPIISDSNRVFSKQGGSSHRFVLFTFYGIVLVSGVYVYLISTCS